jgi:hypothetical protein
LISHAKYLIANGLARASVSAVPCECQYWPVSAKEENRIRRTLISDGSYELYTWDHRDRLTKVEFKTSGGTVTKWVSYV